MNEIQQIKQKSRKLFDQEKYSKALDLYRDLWLNHRSECNEWHGWRYATCLRKSEHSTDALDICREVHRIKPKFKYINNLYAWCIYDLEIKKDNNQIKENEENFFGAVSTIMEISSQDKYSPYVRTVFKVVDYLKEKPSFPAENIIGWLDKLNYKRLSTECFQYDDEEGKRREIGSDKEKWYACKTKALKKLEQYNECIDLCDEALSEIPKFHYDNDIWFKYRIAISKGQMGQKEQAITELKTILKFRKEWYIQHKISCLYFELELFDYAFNYAVDSALNIGDIEKKWKLFLLIGEILIKQDKIEYAKKHVLFAKMLREKPDGKIPQKLQDLIYELNIDTPHRYSVSELHAELKKYWTSEKFASMPQYKGVVKTILPNKKAGFISGDDGKNYYFKFKTFKESHSQIKTGLRVKFYVEEGFDKKKNQESLQATNVKSDKK